MKTDRFFPHLPAKLINYNDTINKEFYLMDTYLVGGAVRDQLLGLPVADKDWVIVGGTAEELQSRGFQQVGKDFPVFLHPDSFEEYALARTERKTGAGHTDFECDAGPTVTLDQDLYRRDLTINAIAQNEHGELIDPYDGQTDLNNKILRHVSPAFSEDPLRILRVARFNARFPEFTTHPETFELMRMMVQEQVLRDLTPERVFSESEKALATNHPYLYFQILADLGAHQFLWAEIQPENIARLKQWQSDNNSIHAFVILANGLTEKQIQDITSKHKFPKIYCELASLTTRFYGPWQKTDISGENIVGYLHEMDALRRPERFIAVCELAAASYRADGNNLVEPDPWKDYLDTATTVTSKDVDQDLTGADISHAIRLEQIRRVNELL
ncbi:MAG: multifunctional CCA tRNA nucleotidyl transferase/2'3'-cyclic phosphodiesterase/2'nucleotidase/phosphatase [Pseudomonadales bacterium]|nr:multifunctional CCA tRNA nucleotidyl transferase/2'3'-cyclic phosphodiesterase/2'nucleotidase/phosphatase [Pseudomonadales bacterium]